MSLDIIKVQFTFLERNSTYIIFVKTISYDQNYQAISADIIFSRPITNLCSTFSINGKNYWVNAGTALDGVSIRIKSSGTMIGFSA